MKTPLILVIFLSTLPLAVSAQTRTFDNWDSAKGVTVYRPEEPKPAVEAPKTKRVRRNGRWVTVPVTPTASTRARNTASASDGLAARESANALRLRMGSNSNLKGFTTGNALHDSYIVQASLKYRIDPMLIYAQMHQESAFKIRATSHKGASGLMQLMPATARRFGVTSIYDPKQNVEAGVRYMRWLLDFFDQDVVLALAGYNAGEGAVLKYGRRVPPYRETQEYVRRIVGRYNTISNPSYSSSAPRPMVAKAGGVEQKDPRPLSIYEPATIAVRLPDGRMMLVTQ